MPYCYAQINEDSVCFAILQTHATIDKPDMIAIDGYSTNLLGKIRHNGQWVDPPETQPV